MLEEGSETAGNLVVSSPRRFPFFLFVLALDSLLDGGGDSALALPPGLMEHGQGRAVAPRELWLLEGGREMCGCRRRWRGVGRAVTVPALLGGQQVGAGWLLATSCAFPVLS